MKKVFSLLLALVCILSLAACGGGGTPDDSAAPPPESNQPDTQPSSGPEDGQKPAAPGDSHYPVTIVNYDYEGNPVEYTYEKAPERVICVYQGCVETMIALGLEDHVLASYGLDNEVKAEWRAGFEKMHYDASVFAPDKETVTLLEPDMIFSWDSYFGEKKLGDVYDWNQKGVATYISANSGAAKTRTLENEYNDILNIGRIFDAEEKAEALVDGMKRQVADALAAVQGQEAVRVAVLEPISGKITNYAADSLAGDMVLQLGGELVKPEGSEMGKEDLVACDPDVIFVVYMAYSGDDPETVKAQQLSIIQDDPAFASLSADYAGRHVRQRPPHRRRHPGAGPGDVPPAGRITGCHGIGRCQAGAAPGKAPLCCYCPCAAHYPAPVHSGCSDLWDDAPAHGGGVPGHPI